MLFLLLLELLLSASPDLNFMENASLRGDRRYCHRCVMSIVAIFIGIIGPNPFINLILMLLFLHFLLAMIVIPLFYSPALPMP